jgi:hypothetical protein
MLFYIDFSCFDMRSYSNIPSYPKENDLWNMVYGAVA